MSAVDSIALKWTPMYHHTINYMGTCRMHLRILKGGGLQTKVPNIFESCQEMVGQSSKMVQVAFNSVARPLIVIYSRRQVFYLTCNDPQRCVDVHFRLSRSHRGQKCGKSRIFGVFRPQMNVSKSLFIEGWYSNLWVIVTQGKVSPHCPAYYYGKVAMVTPRGGTFIWWRQQTF